MPHPQDDQRSRVTFRSKDQVLLEYRRVYAAYLRSLRSYEGTYGEEFNPSDPDIPDAHKFFFILEGMQLLFDPEDRHIFDDIHGEMVDDTIGLNDEENPSD